MWNNCLQHNKTKKTKNGNKTRLFKTNFEFEPYLLNIIIFLTMYIAITILCISCHGLAIETVQYQKPKPLPIRDSFCHTCQQVEDEVNFLCTCKKCFIIYNKLKCDGRNNIFIFSKLHLYT